MSEPNHDAWRDAKFEGKPYDVVDHELGITIPVSKPCENCNSQKVLVDWAYLISFDGEVEGMKSWWHCHCSNYKDKEYHKSKDE